MERNIQELKISVFSVASVVAMKLESIQTMIYPTGRAKILLNNMMQ